MWFLAVMLILADGQPVSQAYPQPDERACQRDLAKTRVNIEAAALKTGGLAMYAVSCINLVPPASEKAL